MYLPYWEHRPQARPLTILFIYSGIFSERKLSTAMEKKKVVYYWVVYILVFICLFYYYLLLYILY